jgi:hypothetical protein
VQCRKALNEPARTSPSSAGQRCTCRSCLGHQLEVVFDCLADPGHEPAYNKVVASTKKAHPWLIGPGTLDRPASLQLQAEPATRRQGPAVRMPRNGRPLDPNRSAPPPSARVSLPRCFRQSAAGQAALPVGPPVQHPLPDLLSEPGSSATPDGPPTSNAASLAFGGWLLRHRSPR